VVVNPMASIVSATYAGMSVQFLNPKNREEVYIPEPYPGKKFFRRALFSSTEFPIKTPKEFKAKAISNQILTIATSASETSLPYFTWVLEP